MVITDGYAQMIIAGPETGRGHYPTYLIHNDDPAHIVYIEQTPNISNIPGSPHCSIPPNGQLVLGGNQTYWARAEPGAKVMIHTVSTGSFSNFAAPAPVTGP
jgi:hypothetical protein